MAFGSEPVTPAEDCSKPAASCRLSTGSTEKALFEAKREYRKFSEGET